MKPISDIIKKKVETAEKEILKKKVDTVVLVSRIERAGDEIIKETEKDVERELSPEELKIFYGHT